MRLKKGLAFAMLLAMSVSAFSVSTSAAEIEIGEEKAGDLVAESINETLKAVFEFLNEKNESISLEHKEKSVYHIPVNKNQAVTVSIENKQVQKEKGEHLGSDSYSVVANTSYIYTLDISNLYSNSGSITYKIKYNVLGPVASGSTCHFIKVTSVDVSTVAPSGFKAGSSGGNVVSGNGNIIVKTIGYANFTRTLLADLNYSINVTVGSFVGNILQMDYTYNW